ncbi:MAG: transketolase [Oscillospiraceae bacterium]
MDKQKVSIADLNDLARKMRHHIVDMVSCKKGKVGHLGGSCSAADIVAALFFYKMNFSKTQLQDPARDRFLLSKGHVALVQYAALAELGVLDVEELCHVKEIDSRLQGHPDKNKTPGIEANTGSLGQGLSLGLGLALAARLDNLSYKSYVLMGDGEQAEGQIWEAATAAAAYKAFNLVGILDHNRIQAMGTTDSRFPLGDLKKKWEAFGWEVIKIDGHDMQQICDALDKADQITQKPVLIYANTVKGKGVDFAENTHKYHNGALTPELFDEAHRCIDKNAQH